MRSFLLPMALFTFASAFPAARATIDTDENRHHEVDGFRGDFSFMRDIGYIGAVRMGVVDFEGTTYYAYRVQDGNGIRLIAADEGGAGYPSQDGSLAVDLHPEGRTLNERVTYLVGLTVRDGLLYVVFETSGQDQNRRSYGNHVYAQAFKTQPGTLKLKEAGPLHDIAPGGREIVDATMLNGDDGLYVHTVYYNRDRDTLSLRSYLLKNNSRDFEPVGDTSLPLDYKGRQANACDAAPTHEFNAAGKLEEAHYIVWGDTKDRIILARFLPKAPEGTQYAVRDTGYSIGFTRTKNSNSVLTLIEGGMKGDSFGGYGLSLIEMSADITGKRRITEIRHLSLSSAARTFVGGWSETNMELDGRPLAPGACVHWGIDKARVLPKGGSVERMGIKFKKEMEQSFRMSLVTFNQADHPEPFPDDKSTCFRTCLVRGNQFVVFSTPKDADGITALDAKDNPPGKDLPPFSAWTLIGVVHGLPPYLPYKAGQGYPSLTFDWHKSESATKNVTDTTEDSKEVTIAASLSGGIAQGVFSAEGSYSYGVKVVDGTTTTTSISRTKDEILKYMPNETTAPPYGPDEFGVLLYSIPVYLSKAYSVRRWNGDRFNDAIDRSVFVTVVAKRSLQTYYYLLDQPELGPFRVNKDGLLAPSADYAPLTRGMAPVPRTSMYNKWKNKGPVDDLDTYAQVASVGDKATTTASKFGAGGFTLDYTYTEGQTKGQAITTTHQGTIKLSGGIDGLFNISVSAAESSSRTLSIETTTTASVGQGFAVEYPQLWSDKDDPRAQPVASITTSAVLIFPKDDQKIPSWTPTLARGSSTPYLLTWLIEDMDPPRFLRKPWKVPGRHVAP